MFTVNLERELIRQNKKVQTPQELLLIKEYEQVGKDVCENEILERLGLNKNAKYGANLKQRDVQINKALSRFNKDKVFHISQIESLCHKYALKFLSVELYKGKIDESVADKVSTFEATYNTRLNSDNTFIVAPPNAFELQSRPIDPLLFVEISDGYYYLVHKWGNDLNVWRAFYSKSETVIAWSLVLILVAVIALGIFVNPLWLLGIVADGLLFIGACWIDFYEHSKYNQPIK